MSLFYAPSEVLKELSFEFHHWLYLHPLMGTMSGIIDALFIWKTNIFFYVNVLFGYTTSHFYCNTFQLQLPCFKYAVTFCIFLRVCFLHSKFANPMAEQHICKIKNLIIIGTLSKTF